MSDGDERRVTRRGVVPPSVSTARVRSEAEDVGERLAVRDRAGFGLLDEQLVLLDVVVDRLGVLIVVGRASGREARLGRLDLKSGVRGGVDTDLACRREIVGSSPLVGLRPSAVSIASAAPSNPSAAVERCSRAVSISSVASAYAAALNRSIA